MNKNQLICPVDGVPVNENKVRIVAFLVLLTTIAYLVTGVIWLAGLLTVDFGLRSANAGRYSPLGNIADWAVKQVKLPYKGTDQAPKRFAARIGLAFSLTIIVVQLLGLNPFLLAGVLAVFAGLESLIGFCAGCYVYTLYFRLWTTLSTR